MRAPLYSYRNVFYDGKEKLHPGFKLGEVLFVLSNTRPKLTPYVEFPRSSVDSPHFKGKGDKIYLTSAYNQSAVRFNDVNGGLITITEEDWDKMLFLFNLNHESINYLLQ